MAACCSTFYLKDTIPRKKGPQKSNQTNGMRTCRQSDFWGLEVNTAPFFFIPRTELDPSHTRKRRCSLLGTDSIQRLTHVLLESLSFLKKNVCFCSPESNLSDLKCRLCDLGKHSFPAFEPAFKKQRANACQRDLERLEQQPELPLSGVSNQSRPSNGSAASFDDVQHATGVFGEPSSDVFGMGRPHGFHGSLRQVGELHGVVDVSLGWHLT